MVWRRLDDHAQARELARCAVQLVDDRLTLSASDLINHLECAHLTSFDLDVASRALTLEQMRTDAADS